MGNFACHDHPRIADFGIRSDFTEAAGKKYSIPGRVVSQENRLLAQCPEIQSWNQHQISKLRHPTLARIRTNPAPAPSFLAIIPSRLFHT